MRKWGFVAVAIAIAGCAGLSPPALADDDEPGAGAHGADRDKAVETENIFGFTAGSDTGDANGKGLSAEATPRIGKRIGAYRALDTKTEFGFGVTDDFNMSFSALGDCHRIRNVPEFDDVGGRCAFNGFGTQVRWRFLDRSKGPFGLTLQLEPSFARIDGGSGLAGRGVGAENKLIFDRELVPGVLFGAVNLLYDVARFRERNALASERGGRPGVSAALAVQVAPKVLLGAEARYQRTYEGLSLSRYSGDAFFVGPTLFAQSGNVWLSAAWNVQVAGREAVNRPERAAAIVEAANATADALAAALAAGDPPPAPVAPDLPVRHRRLNLKDFERHQLKLKVGFDF